MSDTETSTSTKICKRCGEEKPITEFYRQKSAKDGLQSGCKKCDCERSKVWHKENKEHKSVISKIRSDLNKEQISAYNRIRYQENKEHMVAVRRVWRKANPDKVKAYYNAWRKANPEKSAAVNRNRTARLRQATGSHSAEDIKNLLILQRKKCAVCLTSIAKGYHVDHIVAIANGGSNDKYNLQLLCASCNCRKHAKDPIDFMNENGKLI